MTSNGQSPFVTLFMYIRDNDPYKKEVAEIIEEILKQRIQGIKNDSGIYVTPAFPKLVYVLDENNIHKDSEFRKVTDIAIKCSAKRMYPDYISAKIMKENYEGNVFSPMGCVDGKEVITYKIKDELYVESFERMWLRLSKLFSIKEQKAKGNFYMDLNDVYIYDMSTKGFVETYRIIRNKDKGDWVRIKFSNGRTLLCTQDHPLPIINKGRTFVKDTKIGDEIYINTKQYSESNLSIDDKKAWLLGFILCDGCYDEQLSMTISSKGEDDIQDTYIRYMKEVYNLNLKTINHKRGEKGNYKEIKAKSPYKIVVEELRNKFEGIQKINRHIPNEVFKYTNDAKYSFLAGMIDADGYINSQSKMVQIGSTNKELAIQTALLAQTLGIPSRIYINHYNSQTDKIRYRIEFYPNNQLVEKIVCKKKKDNFTEHHNKKNNDTATIIEKEILGELGEFSYDVTTSSDRFTVSGIDSHNCRSFLSPYKDEQGNFKFDGRFNIGVCSINLPQIAIIANGDENKFFEILSKRLELVKEVGIIRYNHLKGVKSDVSPIHWQYGAIARLGKGETIDKYLENGYSTVSLGYIGMYEVCKLITGESNTSAKGSQLALKIMNFLNDTVTNWKKETGLGFGLYGTPAESLTHRFCSIDRAKFGKIKDITDKGYYTNSFHVDVREKINAFEKFKFESAFQNMSLGGCISYIEIPNINANLMALDNLVTFIYDNIQYAEFNTKSDYCGKCGFDGEIKLNNENEWECPQCHNKDRNTLSVVRRTCGLNDNK